MPKPDLGARLQREAPGVRLQPVDPVPDRWVEALARRNVDPALLPERPFPAWIGHEAPFQAQFAVIARRGALRVEASVLPDHNAITEYSGIKARPIPRASSPAPGPRARSGSGHTLHDWLDGPGRWIPGEVRSPPERQ